MRVVWLVGAPAPAASSMERALARERTGLEYLVRAAPSVQKIPDDHLSNPGVIVLLDAFSGETRGFSGLRFLRDKNFRGPVFLFGEPATEEASAAFTQNKLSGFFPPWERADFHLVGGIIHSSIDYDGHVDMQRFIAPGGRSSSETIRSLKDFNAFSQKLSAFVTRFGIDLGRLRKILMALSLPHVKTDTGTPTIEHPFPIYYGMDPSKMVLAAPTFSRGANLETVLGNYSSALASSRSEKPFAGAMFPEFHHISRATQNLVLMSGSSISSVSETIDPVVLLTTLVFPPKDKAPPATYFFSFMHVVPTAEMLPEIANGSGAQAAPQGAPVPETAGEVAAEVAPAPEATPALSTNPLLQSSDLGDLLSVSEPKVVGDAPMPVGPEMGGAMVSGPAFVEGSADAAPTSGDGVSGGSTEVSMTIDPAALAADPELANKFGELARKLDDANQESDRLRKTCDSMGQDIKRLMKERRQPTTDRELRDAHAKLQEQVKTLSAEKLKALEMIATREKQIELMKVQMETIKKEKAA